MAALNNVNVYLNDEQLRKTEMIIQELSSRAGIKISRSAAIGRAIDDLFLILCPSYRTDIRPTECTPGQASA